MTTNDRILRAAQHIDATDIGNGTWAYFANETSSYWVVTAEELAELCDYLDHDDPQISRDAYSHWCAGTSAEEMPEGWSPDSADEAPSSAIIHRGLRLDAADELLADWQEAGEWNDRHAALFRAAGDPTGVLSEDNHDVQSYYAPDGRQAILCPDAEGWIVAMEPESDSVACECGDATGIRCEWTGPISETVTVEYMPEALRASHEAARNYGVYPHNGAIRFRAEASCAQALVESEGDWASIVE